MPANHNVPHTEETKAKMRAAHLGKPNLARRRETRLENGVTLYRCGKCGAFLPKDQFYKNKRTLLGIKSECKSCHTRTTVDSRDKDRARDANREYMRRARKRNPDVFRDRERNLSRSREKNERWHARYQLNLAVRRGEIVRPDKCSQCGRSDLKIQAHHNNYDEPLQVEWLCSECHGEEHRTVWVVEFKRLDTDADLADHWPSLSDRPDGVDIFSQYPVSGEPEA